MGAGDEGTRGTWRNFLYFYLPDMFRRYWGVRFAGGWLGTLFDSISTAILDAALSGYHRGGTVPAYDALRPLGNETSMPQYATETWIQYRDRLATDWDTWAYAGTEASIIDQLALAGAPGAQIFRFSDSGSWSEFVVFYPEGSHPVTGYDSYYGDGSLYGDGSSYGPAGLTREQLSTYRDLILHWKPARWKCPFIVFEISGPSYGTGHTYGEIGLVYGGEQVRSEVQI